MKRLGVKILFGFLFLATIAQAQNYSLPDSTHDSRTSILHDYEKYRHPEEKLMALEKTIDLFFEDVDYQNAVPYIDEFNDLAERQNDIYYKALGNYYSGTLFLSQYKLAKAIQHLIIAKSILLTDPDNPKTEYLFARIYLSSSACYQSCNMLPEAYDLVQEGLGYCSDSIAPMVYLKLNNNLALIYKEMNKMEDAISIYKKILPVLNKLKNDKNFKHDIEYTVNINLGQCYAKLNMMDTALVYLHSANEYALTNANKARYLAVIGSLYKNEKEYIVAENNFQKALNLLSNENDYTLTATINMNIAEIYYNMQKYDSALVYINQGIEYAKKGNELSEETSGLYMKAQILRKQNRLVESLSYMDEHKVMMDSLYKVMNIEELSQLMLQTEIKAIEKEYNQQQYIIKLEHSKERFRFYCLIAILGGVIVIVVLLLNRKRIILKNKKIKEEMLSMELETRNRELAFNVVALKKKNEIFTEVINKLLTIKENVAKDETKDALSRVIKEIEKTNEGNFWEEFEIRFKQVHSDFYQQLIKRFPNLTTNELRLCAFLKLNLTTKEISSITGQSPLSIDKARYRLRKKLGLEKGLSINLTNFISGI
ncbi:MAG: hypothetical protein PHR20_00360 [Bacteroidales bacterium]|nr:hypothetical protein [Bacteroidales bacterium]